MPLVGVNHRQPILNMSKITVHCYSKYENINPFAIGYMINPSLNFSKLFRVQVENFWSVSFTSMTMETIQDCFRNKNTCVMELIIINENNRRNAKKSV